MAHDSVLSGTGSPDRLETEQLYISMMTNLVDMLFSFCVFYLHNDYMLSRNIDNSPF